ncbi:hypothetical protein BDV28DRAFT_149053 [Aspergillus coremiiformis]|uniref:Uncharacterized protein n=1 Tax=Aspergillus coremiiformis TaxID=138285 RepID=A0A5N6Z3X7_9EURO|nr:hypothetical protein BDV28DRAFT_149053 [Aspergillus coremiiformis]
MRGIKNWASHTIKLNCYNLAPLLNDADIVVREEDFDETLKCLTYNGFLECKDVEKCNSANKFLQAGFERRVIPSHHVHFTESEGRINIFKQPTPFQFRHLAASRFSNLGLDNPLGDSFMFLYDKRLPMMNTHPIAPMPLITSLPRFAHVQGSEPAQGSEAIRRNIRNVLFGRRYSESEVGRILTPQQSISYWCFELYEHAMIINELLRNPDDANIDKIRVYAEDARAWFIYINGMVWSSKTFGCPPWKEIIRNVDPDLVDWLNTWKEDYLVGQNQEEQAHEKSSKCLEALRRLPLNADRVQGP